MRGDTDAGDVAGMTYLERRSALICLILAVKSSKHLPETKLCIAGSFLIRDAPRSSASSLMTAAPLHHLPAPRRVSISAADQQYTHLQKGVSNNRQVDDVGEHFTGDT